MTGLLQDEVNESRHVAETQFHLIVVPELLVLWIERLVSLTILTPSVVPHPHIVSGVRQDERVADVIILHPLHHTAVKTVHHEDSRLL